ncbi:MAG: class I SAM-dependent RNA methyltransferase [Chloroflexota bacterium]
MEKVTLIAILTFGLEAVVKREIQALGFENVKAYDGKVEFEATLDQIPRANIWLRSADRVLLKMGSFPAVTFDELFEQTKALPWEEWITKDGKFTVTGKAVKSTLGSVRACQAIVKKAVVERLSKVYKTSWFEETGPSFTIQISMLKDVATLTIDTSGSGLNRRGYRKHTGSAALKETMAAALVQLSFWREDRLLIDPMCGSGTILIEAVMQARNIAPGLRRHFAAQEWPRLRPESWADTKAEARAAIKPSNGLRVFGYDVDEAMIPAAQANAKQAGVADDIVFAQKDIRDLWIDQQYGIIISNFPYGIKMADFQELNQLYISIHKTFRKKKGWSLYVLTADKKFPDYFKRARPDRVRKLFNGSIEVNYYQYYGERPPRAEKT